MAVLVEDEKLVHFDSCVLRNDQNSLAFHPGPALLPRVDGSNHTSRQFFLFNIIPLFAVGYISEVELQVTLQ